MFQFWKKKNNRCWPCCWGSNRSEVDSRWYRFGHGLEEWWFITVECLWLFTAVYSRWRLQVSTWVNRVCFFFLFSLFLSLGFFFFFSNHSYQSIWGVLWSYWHGLSPQVMSAWMKIKYFFFPFFLFFMMVRISVCSPIGNGQSIYMASSMYAKVAHVKERLMARNGREIRLKSCCPGRINFTFPSFCVFFHNSFGANFFLCIRRTFDKIMQSFSDHNGAAVA